MQSLSLSAVDACGAKVPSKTPERAIDGMEQTEEKKRIFLKRTRLLLLLVAVVIGEDAGWGWLVSGRTKLMKWRTSSEAVGRPDKSVTHVLSRRSCFFLYHSKCFYGCSELLHD